jgi:hypothetical protein
MSRFSFWVAASAASMLFALPLSPVRAQQPDAPAAKPSPAAPATPAMPGMSGMSMHDMPSTPAGGHMTGMAKAAPADVATPEALLTAYYESLSGPAGQKRDWNRFLSLFYHEAHLLPAEGKGHAGVMPMEFTPQTYLYGVEPNMLEEGYIVRQVAARSESFGKIRHVWSTYEGRHAVAEAKPFVRGINSFQLFSDGKRWWIVDVVWQPETGKEALPTEYLR